MELNQSLIAELQQEAKNTRKMLERIPENSYDYKPHEKSMTLIRLAAHIAEIPGWLPHTIEMNELDFGNMGYKSPVINNNKELLNLFDDCLKKGTESLEKATNENLFETWTGKNKGTILFSMPRIQITRGFIMNHLVHHRAQLSVYLRMLNVPLPMVYGPTADEQ